jgi:hypothetical protein
MLSIKLNRFHPMIWAWEPITSAQFGGWLVPALPLAGFETNEAEFKTMHFFIAVLLSVRISIITIPPLAPCVSPT